MATWRSEQGVVAVRSIGSRREGNALIGQMAWLPSGGCGRVAEGAGESADEPTSRLQTYGPPIMPTRSQRMDWRDLSYQARASGPPKVVEITRISKDRSGSGWACRADQMEQTRTYNIWDAVRAVIIREFSDDGLPISGKGQSTKTLVDTI
jgi:hypothetical protein